MNWSNMSSYFLGSQSCHVIDICDKAISRKTKLFQKEEVKTHEIDTNRDDFMSAKMIVCVYLFWDKTFEINKTHTQKNTFKS